MLVNENKSISLRLNKKIYSSKAIVQSISDFKECCSINLTEDNACVKLEFITKDERIPLEFSNYALALNRSFR